MQPVSNNQNTPRQDRDLDMDRLSMAMEVATDGMWDWQINTNQTFFDTRYYTMAGYEPGEFPGTFEEWEKRIHPDDLAQVKRNLLIIPVLGEGYDTLPVMPRCIDCLASCCGTGIGSGAQLDS